MCVHGFSVLHYHISGHIMSVPACNRGHDNELIHGSLTYPDTCLGTNVHVYKLSHVAGCLVMSTVGFGTKVSG